MKVFICRTSYYQIVVGKKYLVWSIPQDNRYIIYNMDGKFLFNLDKCRFGIYFYSIKQLRKKKLKKLGYESR